MLVPYNIPYSIGSEDKRYVLSLDTGYKDFQEAQTTRDPWRQGLLASPHGDTSEARLARPALLRLSFPSAIDEDRVRVATRAPSSGERRNTHRVGPIGVSPPGWTQSVTSETGRGAPRVSRAGGAIRVRRGSRLRRRSQPARTPCHSHPGPSARETRPAPRGSRQSRLRRWRPG